MRPQMIETETELDILLRVARRIGISDKRLAQASTAHISQLIADHDRRGVKKPTSKEQQSWEKKLSENGLAEPTRDLKKSTLSHDTMVGGYEYREQISRETQHCSECGSAKLSWVEGVEESTWLLRCQKCGTDAAIDCSMNDE